jgi:hypothetical protein
LIRHLPIKYYYNIQLELWTLLSAIYFLWFSSDDFLTLNIKLVACSFHVFIFVKFVFKFEHQYWENLIMLIVLMVANYFIMIMPTSILIPVCVQTLLLFAFSGYVGETVFGLLHKHPPIGLKEHKDKLTPFFVGNYNQFSFVWSSTH